MSCCRARREWDASAYDLVRATWRSAAAGDFEAWWRRALHDGVIAGSAASAGRRRTAAARTAIRPQRPDRDRLALRPDPCVVGRPLRQQCLAAGMPEAADQAGLGQCPYAAAGRSTEARVSRRRRGHARSERPTIEAPVADRAGHADGVGALTLATAGRGAARSAPASAPTPCSPHVRSRHGIAGRSRSSRRGSRKQILTHPEHRRDAGGCRRAVSDVSRSASRCAAAARTGRRSARPRCRQRAPDDGHAWAMVIDTSRLHRLQCLRGRLPGREQRAGGRARGDRAAAATCTGCASMSTTMAQRSIRSSASSRCPACIASRRRASRSARSRRPCTTAKA